jgi:cardiolipin synthase
MIRHVPNLLSALRLLAAPLAAWLILNGHDIASLVVFALAGSSDAADGYVARRWGVTSRLGAWIDPVADKLLMLFCFTALYNVPATQQNLHATPLWLLMLVVMRDATIIAGWILMRALHLPPLKAPLKIGKASTVVQVLYVFAMLLMLAFDIKAPMEEAAWICGLFTALSGIAYAGIFLRGVFTGNEPA